MAVTFPYRDFLQHAVIWPDRRPGHEGSHNVFLFDDYGTLKSRTGGPPVSIQTDEIPATAILQNNFPNPFTESTLIRYSLGRPGTIALSVFDAYGRLVRLLDAGHKSVGTGEVEWDGRDDFGSPVASGVYFYRLEAGGVVRTGEMLLIR